MSARAIDLAGRWTLTNNSGAYSCPMNIPGDNITAMHAAELIPDPYWGKNEYDLRWMADDDWTIRRKFQLTEKDVDLVIEGLDTIATITVNATRIGETANSFRRYRLDMSEAAVAGENEIAITFHSSTRAADTLQRAQPFPIPYQDGNNDIPNVNMLRKVQCDYGWDWNIALAPFGILGRIHAEPRMTPRIDTLSISQDHKNGCVSVSIQAELSHSRGQDITFQLGQKSQTFEAQTDTPTAQFDIEDPRLWWPAGQGDQPFYDLVVSVGDSTVKRRIGLRQMELVCEEDGDGTGFKLCVNGRDVFAKGANWIPADALAGNITPENTRKLLQSAVDANMNMIRVWGGGRYEADWFYDLCDELGLMVWQDFMFACNIYPSDETFLAEVRAEVADNVARLHHHACLALWCGDNELVGALDWYEVTRANRDRYLVNYDRLNRAIETTLKETCPTAIWWPSSPTKGPMDFGDAWHGAGSGDMHFWSVWHEGRDFEHYRDVAPRFCSEFGFQSYPSMDVIERFADPEDWNIASPVLESHQKNAGGNARIAETMFRYFRWPKSFQDFVWLSQIQQGVAIKTAVEYWRSLKPHCMGTLYWQLNDTWPVCSWSSLDHGGGWKLLHHMAKRFYAPISVSAIPVGTRIELRAVNDTPSPVDVSVAAFAATLDGTERVIGAADGAVRTSGLTLMTLDAGALGPDEVLIFRWTTSQGEDGQDVFAPLPWKAYALRDPGLKHSVTKQGGRYVISVTSDVLAFFVTAEASVPGRFDNNAVHAGPNQLTRMYFTPKDPRNVPKFTLRDLHSATMTV